MFVRTGIVDKYMPFIFKENHWKKLLNKAPIFFYQYSYIRESSKNRYHLFLSIVGTEKISATFHFIGIEKILWVLLVTENNLH